jgi:hypothetical protein
MHEKTWALEGVLGSVLALILIYYVLQPGAYPSRYGSEVGWGAAVVFSLLVIQSFWKTKRIPQELRSAKAIVRHKFAVNKWGGLHVALSIVAFVLVLVHGTIFLLSLLEPSLLIWTGAAAFFTLVLLNLSGLVTESTRPSGAFGRLKRMHLLLMVVVLTLVVVHIEGLLTRVFSRALLVGTIAGFVGALAVFITIPLVIPITHRSRLLQDHANFDEG